MRKYIWSVSLFIGTIMLFASCKKHNNDTPSASLYLDKTSFSQQEVITLTARNFKFAESNTTCKIGGKDVTVVKSDNDTVAYVCVPVDIAAGSQALAINSNGTDASSTITIATSSFPSDPRGYLTSSINALKDNFKNIATQMDSTDPANAAVFRQLADSLAAALSGLSNLSDAEAQAVANYLYANNDVYNTLDGLYTDISSVPVADDLQQKLTKSTDISSTIDEYFRYMDAMTIYLKRGEYKKAVQTALLTAAVGTGQAVGFLQEILYAKMKGTLWKGKGMLGYLLDNACWATNFSSSLTFDNTLQQLSGKGTTINAEVSSGTAVNFKTIRITYRNVQPGDNTSTVTQLAKLAGKFTDMKSLWNSITGSLFDFGQIDFAPLKTRDKVLKDISGISLTVDNPKITIGAISGSGSSFSAVITSTDLSTPQNGALTIKYTDGLAQVTSTVINVSVKDDPNIVVDIDGNKYHVIKIGNQYWLKENLRTTRLRNGDAIGTSTAWSTYTSPLCASCDFDATYDAEYGKLYNWYACTDTRGLAPAGWHIPTAAEWKQLSDFLGGTDVAGGKLKETGTKHWIAGNVASNSSGFTAVPAGFTTGGFHKTALFWSANDNLTASNYAMGMGLNVTEKFILDTTGSIVKYASASVRCIKD